ncbi:MAG: tetratricopeptide repeat protein [Pseudomonadota bacterium]|jgi:tetratricopeptide (TPR) repeat protein|nr:tetratricopeptide repeat protein [Syntrophobacterales bacterium]MDI9555446.1 tetratricopeptide repeat protein [Pseudomonadota bacterium]NLX30859.1 tetratricopeptide repeat protein [Deltaproteobacteria bacterium]HNU84228.1 tetratricopeptide repeat protein [Syntrophales bacterium]HNZ33837.1 tetratricopeptide repeat protein [Syntrophales bacterium]
MTGQTSTEQYERMAQLYMKEKRYPEAIAVYRQLIRMKPDMDSFVLCLAWALKDNGEVEEAVAQFEKLFEKELARRLFTGFAFDELVRLYRETKQHDRLVGVCERAVAVQTKDVHLRHTLGDAYLRAGRHGDALAVFEALAAEEPDSSVFHASVGGALIAAGRYDDAEAAYRRAVENDFPGKEGMFLNRMGQAYMAAGAYERAESAFRRAAAASPEEAVFRCDLGDALVMLGRVEQAFGAYGEAVGVNPAFEASYYNRLGNRLIKENRAPEAVEAFRRAGAADPANAFYRLSLAEALTACGRTGEAKAVLDSLRSPEAEP